MFGGAARFLVCPGGYIKHVSVALCLLAVCFVTSIHLKSCLHFIVSVVLGVGALHRRRWDLGGWRVLPSSGHLSPSLHLHKHKQGISSFHLALYFMYMGSCTMYPFVSGFFRLTLLWDSLMLLCVVVDHLPSSWQSFPLCEYLSTQPLMCIWGGF